MNKAKQSIDKQDWAIEMIAKQKAAAKKARLSGKLYSASTEQTEGSRGDY